jgi:hypothetical protein
MVVAQHAAADAPDHRAVSVEENLECGLVAIRDEPLQQLTIPEITDGSHPEQCLHVAVSSVHGVSPVYMAFMVRSISPRVFPGRGSIDPGLSSRGFDFKNNVSSALGQRNNDPRRGYLQKERYP